MAQMTAASINDLPDSAFAYIEPGGEKDDQGKTVPRSKRHFPIYDAAHVRNALARAPQSPFGDKAMPKIRAAAKKFGIGDDSASRADEPDPGYPMTHSMFLRSYPLEDIRILSRAQGSEYADGRTVEAVTAVFDREAEIHDGQGHYIEVIDRSAFNRAIDHARPQGGREAWRTGVFYNHGMTLHGTPSDRFSVPLGSPLDIRVDYPRLLTVTRYNRTPLAEEILEAINSGDITGHSFTGAIIRSDPQLGRTSRRVGYQRARDGSLTKVRRLELGLREYGPTPFPAYVDTAVVGVRSLLAQLPGFLSTTQDVDLEEMIEADANDAVRAIEELGGDSVDSDTPSDEGPVPDDSPDGHSSRDPEMARHAVLQQIAAARRTRPGLAQKAKSRNETQRDR